MKPQYVASNLSEKDSGESNQEIISTQWNTNGKIDIREKKEDRNIHSCFHTTKVIQIILRAFFTNKYFIFSAPPLVRTSRTQTTSMSKEENSTKNPIK